MRILSCYHYLLLNQNQCIKHKQISNAIPIFKISKASKFRHFCYICLCRITYVVSSCCHGQLTFLQFQFRSFSNKWANFIRCLARSTCQFDGNSFRDMKLKYTYLRIVVHNNSKLILKDFFKLGSAEITYPAQLHLGPLSMRINGIR